MTTDLAVITLRQILRCETSVLFVVHDADGGDWQFLDDQLPSAEEAAVVGLQQMFLLDPSLLELAGLPEGWCARRTSSQAAWQKAPIEPVKADHSFRSVS